MQTEIFINQGIHESRIAILEDGRLAEVWIERPENERTVGDIHKGIVTAVLPGLQAAFVEIGHDRTAFLQVRDMVEADRGETDGFKCQRPRRERDGKNQANCKEVNWRKSSKEAAGHQGCKEECSRHRRSQEASPLQARHSRSEGDQAIPEVH